MSRPVRVVLALVLLATLGQGISLISRGSRGESDIGVFYRTSQLLAAGIGGGLYPRLDAVTTWPVSLSPTGLAIFQPLARLSPAISSAAWALFNLCLLGLSLVSLRALLQTDDNLHPDRIFAWAAVVLLTLSWGSVQVGQFSVLFVACWIAAIGSLSAGRPARASLLLAIPAAVKLYPILMVAVPLSPARNARTGLRQIALLSASLLITCLLVPWLAYGSRAWALNVSFWQHVILSPGGQMQYMQTVRHANQSLDTLLLRYLSYEPDFHDLFVYVPHLSFEKGHVVAAANLVRLIIVLAAVAAVWRWRSRSPRSVSSTPDLLAMAGLWSSTLYLLLPEAKARYAVYTFLGFLPLLQQAVDRQPSTRAWAKVAVLIVLILVLLPGWVQVWGVGFLGPLWLWVENLRHMTVQLPSSSSSAAYHAARQPRHSRRPLIVRV